MSVKAYVLIDVMVGKNEEILKAISGMEGVKSIHAVTGPHDLIALVEGEDLKSMGDIVLSRIRGVKGVIKTLTCMVIDIHS
jgi:DNA-binding Lrp family transcriptional regulator